MERVICLIMGYIFGLFQTGYIYGKMQGIDIRERGSGNSGTTNALRVLGKQAGFIVLLGDIGKCLIACTLCRMIFGQRLPDMELLLVLYTGIGVILGHNFPFYMNFKGGKGIAATGGMVIALFDIRVFAISLAVLLFAVILTRYVSLGSILGLITVFISWTVCTMMGTVPLGSQYWVESCVVLFFAVALGIFRHRTNIVRLLKGTENKLGQRAK